ncbi:DUF1214 domain-containing protein [Gordonia sp. (in: high G+C Gram-positive bacteria)]|uniref:DUF1214 domain-containing protein n=1 Tax=Gordonia sp. (in: high G+C Gram-positive bacteria) TaxID=84139 RepID=UPI001694B47D|nr:DUF1214 domain-containing protein [Gordonia sp. (in: high G+C Gram-positive bacteria)]NLG45821.1 DUF1214 domain-containing protein [Gordonia sp. (in: high G+C Gram-positive bacteria)]
MFAGIAANAGGTNVWHHYRVPTPIDQQTVIRMNRDTLYSAAVVDISRGATLTIPEAGERYLSVMIVNQDHYINRVFHEAGEHSLTPDELGSDFVLVAARVLVDAEDPADVAAVNALQDGFGLESVAGGAFVPPVYDEESFQRTRNALLELARGLGGMDRCFGRREDVDPIRHLLGTATGWGGLPEQEAYYVMVDPGLPVGEYSLTVGGVPVDGFWSVSMYNADGYFAPNPQDAYSVNNITAVPNADGTVTIRFGGDLTRPNTLPIVDGWNYAVRLYRPRPEIIDGTWQFPTFQQETQS